MCSLSRLIGRWLKRQRDELCVLRSSRTEYNPGQAHAALYALLRRRCSRCACVQIRAARVLTIARRGSAITRFFYAVCARDSNQYSSRLRDLTRGFFYTAHCIVPSVGSTRERSIINSVCYFLRRCRHRAMQIRAGECCNVVYRVNMDWAILQLEHLFFHRVYRAFVEDDEGRKIYALKCRVPNTWTV